MVRTIKRKAFTLIEAMFVIVVLSLVLLGVYAMYTPFQEIREEVEMKAKLKNFYEVVSNGFYDSKRVKQMLKSTVLVDNNGSIDEPGIYYFDNSSTPNFVNIMVPEVLSNFDMEGKQTKEALQNFLNVNFDEDLLFYRNMFYKYSTVTEKLFGYIDINYKKFSFIHINDAKFATYLKRLDFTNQVDIDKFDEMFDTTQDFISVKNNDLNLTNGNGDEYVKENWKRIRKKINVVKFSTRDQVVESIKHIKNQMDETQKKLIDWATIQSRYEAHKSISTGNTLNTDYFITCVLQNGSTNNTCLSSDVLSVKTLIKLDDKSSTPNTSNRMFLYTLGTTNEMKAATSDYGFLVINNAGIQSTTDDCTIEVTDEDGKLITFENALNFSRTQTTLNTPPITISSDCITSDGMSTLAEDFNLFGYPIMFSNAETSTINGTIKAGFNRYPNLTTEAPYNATLFTILPNNAVISKKLYGHIF